MIDKNRRKASTKYGKILEEQLMLDLKYEKRRRNVFVRSVKFSLVFLLFVTLFMLILNYYYG